MRSLWQDIEVMEDTLPELQKIGNELAADSGDRGSGIARDLCSLEVSVIEIMLCKGGVPQVGAVQDRPNFEVMIKEQVNG